MWRANLEQWQPPDWPADKLKAIDNLLARARREFETS
jgi:hypothetical protein